MPIPINRAFMAARQIFGAGGRAEYLPMANVHRALDLETAKRGDSPFDRRTPKEVQGDNRMQTLMSSERSPSQQKAIARGRKAEAADKSGIQEKLDSRQQGTNLTPNPFGLDMSGTAPSSSTSRTPVSPDVTVIRKGK